MQLVKKIFPLLIIILSFFAIKPLFAVGFFPMHDNTQVARVYEMSKALHDGMFPVRWVPDLGYGYGYPIFNFYAPLAYYIGGIFVLLGANALLATKLMMGIGIILSGLFMYILAKSWWGEYGGLVSGVLYVYATYHAVDIYVRGDVAEFWAYAFVPLAVYGIWKAFTHMRWQYVVIGGIGYAAVIISHNLTALLISPFLLVFSVVLTLLRAKTTKSISAGYPFISFFLGLLLSGFYWVPVLGEMKYTNVLSQVGGSADFRSHFVCLAQFWYSPWGYGGSGPHCISGFSFMLGKVYILFGIVAVGVAIGIWKKHTQQARAIMLGACGALVSLYLTTVYSQGIWEIVSPMAFFQYPWRFLLLFSFFLAAIAGSIFWVVQRKITSPVYMSSIVFSTIAIIFFFQVKFFVPQTIVPVTAASFTNPIALRFTASKISDEYLPKNFIKPKDQLSIVKSTFFVLPNNGKVLSTQEKTQEKRATILITQSTAVLINIAYFPAWHVFVDGEQVPFRSTNKGLSIYLLKGRHTLSAQFAQTPFEQAGNLQSVAGILVVIIGIILERRNATYAKTSA